MSIIVSDKFAIEEETLFNTPMVQSIAVHMALDIQADKVTLDVLDTWQGMIAIGREFQRLGVPYETIGGPARAMKRAVKNFLEVLELSTKES